MWVRGLKLVKERNATRISMSHPMWVRGLKQKKNEKIMETDNVAPYVGAWIETRPYHPCRCI